MLLKSNRLRLSLFRFSFSLFTLTTPSSRNPQGVTMPRYLRLIAAGVIEAYGFHLSVFRLYNELPYLAVAEEGNILVGHSLYLSLHDAAEEAVAEGKDFLVRVLATHLVKELVSTLLH